MGEGLGTKTQTFTDELVRVRRMNTSLVGKYQADI